MIRSVTASGAPGGSFIVTASTSPRGANCGASTIARPAEPGGQLERPRWRRRSGGSVWQQGSYDKGLNLVYFGVGQTYDTGR